MRNNVDNKTCNDVQTVAVIYARFSSHNQRDESIEQQVAECRAYAIANGLKVIEVYADSARSGRSDRRPAFLRLKNAAKKGEFGVILAYKSNRIARNMLNAMTFENDMEKLGIRVLYAKEEFGNNAAGRFALRTMMNVNQFFSENMGEDIKRNQQDNALNCRANGPASYGYRTGEDGRYEIEEETASVVREIFSRVASGHKFVDIADDLNKRGIRTRQGNKWGKSSFAKIIKNERYIGTYIFDNVRIEGGMPEIVSKDLFYTVQDRLANKKNPQGRKRENGEYLLTGKLYCGECKSYMIGMSGTSENGTLHHYYVCNEKRSSGSCTKRNVRRDVIEIEVTKAIRKYVLTDDVIEWIADAVEQYQREQEKESEIAALEMQLKHVGTSIKNLLRAVEQGATSTTVTQRLIELETEQSQLTARIARLKAEEIHLEREYVIVWLESLRDGDVEEKEYQKELFNSFVKKIYIFDDGRVKVLLDLLDEQDQVIDLLLDEEYADTPSSYKVLNGSPKRQASFEACLFLLLHYSF